MKYVMDLNSYMKFKEGAANDTQITKFSPADETDGFFDTADGKIQYHYDGTALHYSVVNRYTLAAHIAGDGFWEKFIDAIIAGILSAVAAHPPTIEGNNEEKK